MKIVAGTVEGGSSGGAASPKLGCRGVRARATWQCTCRAAKCVGTDAKTWGKRRVAQNAVQRHVFTLVVPPRCDTAQAAPSTSGGSFRRSRAARTPWRSVWAFLNVMCMHATKTYSGAVVWMYEKRPVARSFVVGCVFVRGDHPRTRGSGPCFRVNVRARRQVTKMFRARIFLRVFVNGVKK